MSSTAIPSFTFLEQDYTVLEELVNAMGMNWQEGRQLLYSGQLREHTRKVLPSFANSCALAEKDFQSNSNEGNRIFLKWLCKYAGIRNLYWQGANYGGIKRIAATLASAHEETLEKLLHHMLKTQLLDAFLKNIGGTDELVENVRFLEKAYNKSNSRFSKHTALTILECILAGEKVFAFAGRQFKTPSDLAAYLQISADTSKETLSRTIQPLFQDDYNFEPRFEAWIIMHGYHHELMLWKGHFQEGQGDAEDIEDIYFDDEQEHVLEARQQPEPDFEKSLEGFEDKFLDLLSKYHDRIDNPTMFSGLMSDYFPMNKLQSYLLIALYRMDIIKALRDASELTSLLTVRFEKRLIKDYGVKESFAKWAVEVWCHCYGELILKKSNSI